MHEFCLIGDTNASHRRMFGKEFRSIALWPHTGWKTYKHPGFSLKVRRISKRDIRQVRPPYCIRSTGHVSFGSILKTCISQIQY